MNLNYKVLFGRGGKAREVLPPSDMFFLCIYLRVLFWTALNAP